MDQLDAMRAFVRVAELESFTRCAEQTGIPKATLSAAIRRLEERVGTRLLLRTTRRVQLTTDGQLCYARCRELLADMEEFDGLFRQGGQISGQLRVDMPSRMARHLVIPALPDFLAQHPALQLMLSSTDRRVDLVREGFDCVVRVGGLEPSSLVARPLGHYRQINCASAGYLARHGVPRTLGDLAGHRLVHYGPGFGAGQGRSEPGFEYLAEDGRRALLPMAGALMVNDSETYLAAALAGLGIIQMPRVGVESLLAGGELVSILPQWQPPPLPIHALYAHRRQLAPRVQLFIHWLAGLLAAHLGGTSEAAAP
ncbi:LysR family transcriptional regulator [Aeromonas caviae]|uniref:LysR family transcriptional regulator n=1 Tax=Aeromonas caviae TaxID=648 RepID=UPI0029D4D375|nr:LysR family transcriptional regulator [Aeromonas caviae]MDX7840843.1 LysR family transcriptional regulator [Aeromonas caviae]